MIIDGHAHISPTSFGNVDLYIQQLQEAGIQRGVLVPGGMMDVRRITDYITGKEKPKKEPPNNQYVDEACKNNPDLFTGFACVNPHDSNAVEQLEEYFKSGFRGLKMSPMTHQFSFASKTVAALAELCGDYGYPFYTHVVFNPGASTTRFISLAQQFPKTNFILGHMGFGPADTEALEAAAKMDNFFLETSTGSYLHIKEAVEKAGATKIIFGSEFPLSHPVVELQKILLLNLSDDHREKILGGNIKSLLSLA
jgi:uncharacterized protein